AIQAEDGIRDDLVTGVQTCALPIYCYVLCDPRFVSGLCHGFNAVCGSILRRSGLRIAVVAASRRILAVLLLTDLAVGGPYNLLTNFRCHGDNLLVQFWLSQTGQSSKPEHQPVDSRTRWSPNLTPNVIWQEGYT